MRKGGYEEGYATCDCFWGMIPAEMVTNAIRLQHESTNLRAIELGCGQGKNIAAAAESGYQSLGLDISMDALSVAQRRYEHLPINFLLADISKVSALPDSFDLVIATGSLHCLKNKNEILKVIKTIKKLLKEEGLVVVSSFNDGSHDFAGHDKGFKPTLLSHNQYLNSFEGWEIIGQSNITQTDCHPNNGIEHYHSISRLLMRKKAL